MGLLSAALVGTTLVARLEGGRPTAPGRTRPAATSPGTAGARSVADPSAVSGTTSSGPVPPAGKAPTLDLRAVLRAAEPGTVDITDYGAATGTAPGRATGAATGMVLDTAGHVLTNAHVVAKATTFSVRVLGQSTLYQARVLAADQVDDVAVLQIQDPGPLTPVQLGHSAEIQVGDPVVAIGNALGLSPGGPSVTSGIISALGRRLSTDNGSGGTETLTALIQTDAPINPGNSGGPLLDATGKVIAMNTAVSTAGQNIGFSIPIDRITPLLGAMENGTVPPSTQGYLGVSLQTPATGAGAQVMTVASGSPAASAGLQVGDVITAVDGSPAYTGDEAAGAISSLAAGTQVQLSITRGGAGQTVDVALGPKPAPTAP